VFVSFRRIQILDTTLSHGADAPGLALPPGARAELARQLERLGVDVVEAGFPAASPAEREGVRAVAAVVRRTTVCAVAGPRPGDVDAAAEALAGAPRSRIHLVVPADVGLERVRRLASRAARVADEVQLSCTAAAESKPALVAELCRAAVAAGASVVGLPDDGRTLPARHAALVADLRQRRPELGAVFSVRCRDDLGLAVAGTLACVAAGAGQVECAVNGLGARAGVAALEEVVVALRVRGDRYGAQTGVDATELMATSRLAASLTGARVPPNKAVVGANAFAHEAGIHQDGMLKDARTYQIVDPREVGGRMTLPLGKHSGRHAFARACRDRGVGLAGEELNTAFRRFKALADGGRAVSLDDLMEGVKA
jgi:2-isopropylmalate synthase